jgi:hypothetical protein
METEQSRIVEDLAKFYEAAWFDLPVAAAQRLLGLGDEENLSEVGWKAYDAWIRLGNTATNRFYANHAVGGFTGRAMETALKVRRVGDALAAAFFGNLWPAIGLPTAAEIHHLRDELIALRELVAAIGVDGAKHAAPRIDREQGTAPPDGGPRLIWKGAVPEPQHRQKRGSTFSTTA